jgi:hypothetical protein
MRPVGQARLLVGAWPWRARSTTRSGRQARARAVAGVDSFGLGFQLARPRARVRVAAV